MTEAPPEAMVACFLCFTHFVYLDNYTLNMETFTHYCLLQENTQRSISFLLLVGVSTKFLGLFFFMPCSFEFQYKVLCLPLGLQMQGFSVQLFTLLSLVLIWYCMIFSLLICIFIYIILMFIKICLKNKNVSIEVFKTLCTYRPFKRVDHVLDHHKRALQPIVTLNRCVVVFFG